MVMGMKVNISFQEVAQVINNGFETMHVGGGGLENSHIHKVEKFRKNKKNCA